MAERANWTGSEIASVVESYFRMLKQELAGKPYVKSHENARLRESLNGRTNTSVEYKHQNISAVLMQNGWPYVRGYKPAVNLQAALRNEVERRLRLDSELEHLADMSTDTEIRVPDDPGVPFIAEPPLVSFGTAEWTPRSIGIKRDFLYRDQLNGALGLSGELAAMRFEISRLLTAGRPDLARRVEHVALTVGDGLGYDVKSFEADGASRYIEVKTTTHPAETAFFVSSNEVSASKTLADEFQLYRFFNFTRRLGLYMLAGPLEVSAELRPIAFSALPKVPRPS
jgi:hypothetical protein